MAVKAAGVFAAIVMRVPTHGQGENFNPRRKPMRQQLRTAAVTLVLLASAGLAAAQTAPSRTPGTVLNQQQEQDVAQQLKSAPAQSSSTGSQTQLGSKLPDSVQTQSLPNNVTAQVPEAKNLLFVKFPDRILLIDPDTKIVAEVIMDSSSTTGSSPASPSGTTR
jgi:hypothetical protein